MVEADGATLFGGIPAAVSPAAGEPVRPRVQLRSYGVIGAVARLGPSPAD